MRCFMEESPVDFIRFPLLEAVDRERLSYHSANRNEADLPAVQALLNQVSGRSLKNFDNP